MCNFRVGKYIRQGKKNRSERFLERCYVEREGGQRKDEGWLGKCQETGRKIYEPWAKGAGILDRVAGKVGEVREDGEVEV